MIICLVILCDEHVLKYNCAHCWVHLIECVHCWPYFQNCVQMYVTMGTKNVSTIDAG